MKVLFLVNNLNTDNGWGRHSLEVINGLKDLGVTAVIATEKESGYPGEHVILKRSLGTLTCVPALRKLIKQEQPNMIHSLELNPYAISATLAAIGLGIPEVITAPGAYSVKPLYDTKTSFLAKHAYRMADGVYPISQFVMDEIKKKVSIDTLQVITLGVVFSRFSGQRQKADKPFILGVGNLSKRKGYITSVEAFARAAQDLPGLHYYIAGKNNEQIRKECRDITDTYGVTDRVVFLGSVGDEKLRELYLSAELFILTSINVGHHFEGFGLVFLEAASAGLPVIGTQGCGITDAVNDGENGILVPQHDVGATTNALKKILLNEDLKKRMGEESIVWAKTHSWKRVAEQHMDAYKEILKKEAYAR